MTSREYDIIEFIQKYRVVTTSTLCHFFFKSINSCYKVTHRMFVDGHIKRMKLIENNQNSEFIYYINKPPQQLKHMVTITNFMAKWDNKYGIQDFDVQRKLGSIIPDAIMLSNNQLYIVEIELSNKGFNYYKYEKFFTSNEYLDYFNYMPTVLIYGKASIPSNTNVNYRVIGIS